MIRCYVQDQLKVMGRGGKINSRQLGLLYQRRVRNEFRNLALPLIEWVTLTGQLFLGKDLTRQDESKWHSQTALYCENLGCGL